MRTYRCEESVSRRIMAEAEGWTLEFTDAHHRVINLVEDSREPSCQRFTTRGGSHNEDRGLRVIDVIPPRQDGQIGLGDLSESRRKEP